MVELNPTSCGQDASSLVDLMTDCTILEGLDYHAFRGPRPVAWDQNLIILMLTGNASSDSGAEA